MAVADLNMSLTDFRNLACSELFAGSSVDYSGLDAGEQTDIDRLILRGERRLWLHPPGLIEPYVWSCLMDPGLLDLWGDIAVDSDVTVDTSGTTVTASEASFYETMVGKTIIINSVSYTIASVTSSTVLVLSSTAGTQSDKTFSIASNGTFRLPSDFESPASSKLVFTEDPHYPDIRLLNKQDVDRMRSQTQTGYPQYAYIEWNASDGTAAQTQQLVTWPESDAHYPVQLPFKAQPQGMSEANPYLRGGPEMANVFTSVLLATCEEAKLGQRGDRWAEAAATVAQAVQRDRSRHHNFWAGVMRADAGQMDHRFDVKRLIQPTS